MKIACMIFAPMESMGGVQVFTFNFLSKLTELGHDVTLYLADDTYDKISGKMNHCPYRVKALGFETVRMSLYAPIFMKALVKLVQKREKFDLWQIMGAFPAGYIASALKGKVPLVLRCHGEDIQKSEKLNYGKRLNPAFEKKIKTALHSMDRVVALSRDVYNCYEELQVPVEKIVRIPNCVNTERFMISSEKIGIRVKNDLSADAIILVTVGRYHIKKGYDLIPSIAEYLRKKHINFKWLLIGKGVDRLKKDIEAKNLVNDIRIKDEIGIEDTFDRNGRIQAPNDELIALLKCSDIFVFPTRLEGFGMVLIEAFAAGLPVVTTKSPGVEDVIEHNKTGLLSESDDVEAIASNIIKVIEDNDLRERLVQNAKTALRKYDLNTVTRQYLRLYSQLVEKFMLEKSTPKKRVGFE